MAETNSILAGLDSTKIHDAVNWGDLGCTAVEKVKTFFGNATSIEWRVLIEEASPDAYEFRTLAHVSPTATIEQRKVPDFR
jgi:hypothetical protein